MVVLPTTEAEYIVLCTAAQEATWLRRLLADIKAQPGRPTNIKEDNQNTIAIARNPVSHTRTKHIDVQFHFIRETLNNGCIYWPTEQMVADVLTKPISRDQFEVLHQKMWLINLQSL